MFDTGKSKVKLSLFLTKYHATKTYQLLNEASRHEVVLWEVRYESTHS